jgi:DNA-binding transcriptional LysR family regulator
MIGDTGMDRLSVMETFVRIVEMGSFSAAARRMNVGQPTVSKTIAQLEERLGVRLLMRSTHGLRPTEAGQTYFERARVAILEADEAERAARGVNAGLEGRLRISACVAFGKLHLIPHLSAFLATHPELSIDLVLEDRPIDLLEEGFDLALRPGPLCDSTLVARTIARTDRLVLATPEYFRRAGEPQNPNDLARHQAVVYALEPDGGGSWLFRKGREETLAKLPDRLRVSGSEAVRTAVLRGLGLTVAPRWMFDPELRAGEVRAVLTNWCLPQSDLWVVFTAGRLANAKTRAFVRFVESILEAPLQVKGPGFNPSAADTPQATTFRETQSLSA